MADITQTQLIEFITVIAGHNHYRVITQTFAVQLFKLFLQLLRFTEK